MANLKQAFEYASQNPNSDFAKNLEQLAGSGALNKEAEKYGIDLSPFQKQSATQQAKDLATGFVKGAGRTLVNTASGIQDIGQLALGGAESLLTGKDLSQTRAMQPEVGFESLKKETPEGQAVTQALQPKNEMEKMGGYAETGAEILAGGGAQILKAGVTKGAQIVADVTPKLGSLLPKNLAGKAIDLISSDPEAKVATILKESTPDELNNYLSIAQKASQDPRVATPFEVVGNKLSDTTKVLQTKLNEIGQRKSEILQPMREGLDSFKNETKPLINKLTSLKNSFGEIDKTSNSKVSAIISDAKKVSTKLDADKFIDKLQDMLYSGNIDMTIPRGSALDKQLRNIVGEYNSLLKKSLPEEYGNLNAQYSELIDSLDIINRSLGEVVEGVPVRGASLIKQFFSPSGTKAKEIFEFVKKETNGEVDLAKDSTLAKFSMELFEDPRARSLLQGIGDIPTTASGIVSKVLEKVGGDKIQEAMRTSTVKKAKQLTKPSFNAGTVPQTVQAFDKSKVVKEIGDFVLGTFGINASIRKQSNKDRFNELELEETLKNIVSKYKASSNVNSYRKDNIAWIAKMPNGEKRVVYTRLNNNGKEEIINWHKISNDKYIKDLSKNGVPGRTRTSNPFVRTE